METTGKPGTGLTVTNLPASYELPHTGGTGTSLFTFGGLLMIIPGTVTDVVGLVIVAVVIVLSVVKGKKENQSPIAA